jgi:hypothetical protein
MQLKLKRSGKRQQQQIRIDVPLDILLHRLNNQQLTGSGCNTPSKLVNWMGAIQAQDYSMSKWAVGIRVPGSTVEEIEKEIDEGKIIRTHVLRPTWHLVDPNDVRWMLELTAPHVNRKAAHSFRELELDEKLFRKTNTIIQKLLSGNNQLTREEIMAALVKKGIPTNDLRGAHLMLRAELDRVVCNGARKGKQFTYALLDDRVPAAKKMHKEEAIIKLAERYFTSHGPASMQDFAWWSGLPVAEARVGVEALKKHFLSEKIGNQVFWFNNDVILKKNDAGAIHLLPAYDEWMISYADRSASLDEAYVKEAILGNGIFKPVILLDGRVVGIWKRIIGKDKVTVEAKFLFSKSKIKKRKLYLAAEALAKFHNAAYEVIIQ